MRSPRRRRSIRFSLVGLIIVPLVSLITLWGFAAQSTASKAINQRNLDTTNEIYGGAAQPGAGRPGPGTAGVGDLAEP
ncbi:hypothetical protein [Actinomadura madurae]|uniref:hypothetical protein n=1 Tax=Actinomadura madurae TaxID=1993 RepID=UPI0020D24689|nr:hypothetical protein [Actinomadura madurae]MCP9951037.1 hypothetical protein [Actinomadura madurae]MCP9967818.1 hypothetical protein [Actinomadura madurae]MCQ0008209.1 hypothetical protein [Actinomadura madurae]